MIKLYNPNDVYKCVYPYMRQDGMEKNTLNLNESLHTMVKNNLDELETTFYMSKDECYKIVRMLRSNGWVCVFKYINDTGIIYVKNPYYEIVTEDME